MHAQEVDLLPISEQTAAPRAQHHLLQMNPSALPFWEIAPEDLLKGARILTSSR